MLKVPVVLLLLGIFFIASSKLYAEVETDTMAWHPDVPVRDVAPLTSAKDYIRVATVQIDYLGADPVAQLLPYIQKAANDFVDLLVFPEYVLGSFKLGDERIQELGKTVAEYGMYVVIGGWETLGDHPIQHPPVPKTYANTVIILGRDGNIVGYYRKMHPAVGGVSRFCWPPLPDELGEWQMVWGEELPVFDLDFGRVGILTCYDGYFFPTFEIPSLKGAEVLIWANGRGGMIEDYIVRSASFMTCTHVVASNMALGAGGMICSYPGTIQAVIDKPGEAYIKADLDLKSLRVERRNNRMMHQRRPEAYGDLMYNWKTWNAYPDIPAFQHEVVDTTDTDTLSTSPEGGSVVVEDIQVITSRNSKDSEIKVALLQMLAEGNNQEANLLKADAYCRKAAALGADIALFPEMFNIGYTGFHMVPDGTSEAWQAQAVQLTSHYVTHFKNLAKELDMAIAVTCLEAWETAPRNSLVLIDRHGDLLYTYAKMHTTDFSQTEAVTTPGEEVYVARLDTRKGEVAVGAMICYDREFPETARMLMLKGAEIILTPNACKLDDVRLNQFQARAFENALAVFMTNYPAPQHNGRSVAYGPGGEVLALADDTEGIFIAGIDLEALRNTRNRTIWGDAFRRPHRYKALSEDLLKPVWERQDAFGNPYNRMNR